MRRRDHVQHRGRRHASRQTTARSSSLPNLGLGQVDGGVDLLRLVGDLEELALVGALEQHRFGAGAVAGFGVAGFREACRRSGSVNGMTASSADSMWLPRSSR